MSEQRERVKLLPARLLSSEAARRKAVADGNMQLHNDLANMNREMIGETSEHDLRSLVTRWMLERARDAELLEQTRAALQVALAHAGGELPGVGGDVRRAELDGCREALRLATEAVQR